MLREKLIQVLEDAGFAVEPCGERWHVCPPVGSRGADLVPDGVLLDEWALMAIARVIDRRGAREYRMREASRWN